MADVVRCTGLRCWCLLACRTGLQPPEFRERRRWRMCRVALSASSCAHAGLLAQLNLAVLQSHSRELDSCLDVTAAQAAHQLCRVVLLAGSLRDAKEDAEAVHSHCVCARSQAPFLKRPAAKVLERKALSRREVRNDLPACQRPAEPSQKAQK